MKKKICPTVTVMNNGFPILFSLNALMVWLIFFFFFFGENKRSFSLKWWEKKTNNNQQPTTNLHISSVLSSQHHNNAGRKEFLSKNHSGWSINSHGSHLFNKFVTPSVRSLWSWNETLKLSYETKRAWMWFRSKPLLFRCLASDTDCTLGEYYVCEFHISFLSLFK